MTDKKPAASVTILIFAVDENGKPLTGVRRILPVDRILHADYPVLIETCTDMATEIDEAINRIYG